MISPSGSGGCLLLIVFIIGHADHAAAQWIVALDGSLGLEISKSGATSAIIYSGNENPTYILGNRSLQTRLDAGVTPSPSFCVEDGEASVVASAVSSGVAVQQTWKCTVPQNDAHGALVDTKVTVVDTFSPAPNSFQVSTSITTDQPVYKNFS